MSPKKDAETGKATAPMLNPSDQPSHSNPLDNLIELRRAIEDALEAALQPSQGCPQRLTDAMRYSVLTPGKRLRPLLALLAARCLGADETTAMPAAVAVELVHVYSLIHDDLPAMDDDDLRRGKPTCHRQFDEATAILAGDALQMRALEILATDLPADIATHAVRLLSNAAGQSYLVGGQMDDLSAEGRFGQIDVDEPLEFLKAIHRRKTSALIEVSLKLGGLSARGSQDDLKRLELYGQGIGLAFQIVDDCLDVESTPELMGKATRKDDAAGKMTYPALLGLTESRALAESLIESACEQLASYGPQASDLIEIAKFVVERRS